MGINVTDHEYLGINVAKLNIFDAGFITINGFVSLCSKVCFYTNQGISNLISIKHIYVPLFACISSQISFIYTLNMCDMKDIDQVGDCPHRTNLHVSTVPSFPC